MDKDRLLGRQASEDYIYECTENLKRVQNETHQDTETSVLIFRLGNEWFALNTQVFNEVAEIRSIHRVPNRKGKALMGVVNVRGQLRVCISLHHFLDIDTSMVITSQDPSVFQKFMVVQQKEEVWVFPVDEIYGIYRFSMNQLHNVPVNILKSTANYLRGIIPWGNSAHIGYLDEELLFQSLRRSIL